MSSVVAAALVIAALTAGDGKQLFGRADLWGYVLASSVNYGSSNRVGSTALYRGEPLELRLWLSSTPDRPTAVEDDWLARIRVHLRPGSILDRAPRPGTELRCLGTRMRAQAQEAASLLIPARQQVSGICTLMLDTSSLTAGEYTLAVAWGDVDDRRLRRPARSPSRDMGFHLLETTGEADAIDREIHLGERATAVHGRHGEALQRLAAVLARHPNSVPARVVLAAALRAAGDSRAADIEQETAARLAEDGRDELLVAARGEAYGKWLASRLRGHSALRCVLGR